jgi:putative membrane protein
MNWSVILSGVVETAIYSLVGVILMGIAFFLVKLVIPFSIRKEIEEDQNISLSIIIGAVILGIAIIVASVINSPSATNSVLKPNCVVESPSNK